MACGFVVPPCTPSSIMPANPKTPAKRSSRLNSEKRTPLSPSISHGISNISLNSTSPKKSSKRRGKSTQKKTRTYDTTVKTKTGDTSNPFISSSDIPRPRTQSLSKSLNYDFRAALDLSGSSSRPTTPAKKFTEMGSFAGMHDVVFSRERKFRASLTS